MKVLKNISNKFNYFLHRMGITVYFPMRTYFKVRKYWKPPKMRFAFGKAEKVCEKFNYYVSTNYLKWNNPLGIKIDAWDIGWKDKFADPRFEQAPFFSITFGRNFYKAIQFVIWWEPPKVQKSTYKEEWNGLHQYISDYDYWESILYYLYYARTGSMWNKGYNEETGRRNLGKAFFAKTDTWSTWINNEKVDLGRSWDINMMKPRAVKIIEKWKKENITK